MEEVDLSARIRREALHALEVEPELSPLLHNTVLASGVESFEDAVASSIAYKLSSSSHALHGAPIEPATLQQIFQTAMRNECLTEGGHAMCYAVRKDVLAVLERDPACETLLEVVLFFKGFAALVVHRVARQKWNSTPHSMTALYLQSACSALFGLDIHPAATIGAGVLLDHGTGIVIGETAVIGDGCTMLHGVTLGGTGKDSGDRHPKVGQNCLIGAGTSILGNIRIGEACKIGAGSIVLRPIPDGATAVGAPAKIIGRCSESNPAKEMDRALSHVALLHKSKSSSTLSSTDAETTTSTISEMDDSESESGSNDDDQMCPFREYTKLSKRAPPGTITICRLANLLLPEGCTRDEIGSIFFSLDIKNCGYVRREYCEKFLCPTIHKNVPRLPEARIEELLQTLLKEIPLSLRDLGKSRGSANLSKQNQMSEAVQWLVHGRTEN